MTEKITIKLLDAQTSRRISSGQVIHSMASAVNELIENSVDARSTSITINFVDHGKESIEVIDNGCGIDEENFELLGRRHCTSKLLSADDLNQVQTFGFRGEALNSLCNISRVKIHTRSNTSEIGTLLEFDENGYIVMKTLRARDVGTTVKLQSLFHSMPVRRKDLRVNWKRSFDKCLSLIYQYCLGAIGRKLTCKLTHLNGRHSVLFSSNGVSIQSNIIEIFDNKQFSLLMPFVLNQTDTRLEDLQIEGFVSRPDNQCGRSASDRQYFYINDRPCDLPTVAQRINKMYRSFNTSQYPFVLIKIKLDETLLDRNLMPDKRKILLNDDNIVFKVIESSIEKMFACRSNNEIKSLMNESSQALRSTMSSFLKRKVDEQNDEIMLMNNSLKVPNVKTLHSTPLKCGENRNMTTIEDDSEKHSLSKTFKHPFFGSLFSKKTSNQIDQSSLPIALNSTLSSSSIGAADIIPWDDDEIITDDSQSLREIISERRCRTVMVDFDDIRRRYAYGSTASNSSKQEAFSEHFKAKISPEDNEVALKELKHFLSKSSFIEKMSIVGQFNLGFIISKMDRDLFIVDQHAIDERFNFEKFLLNPQVSHQNLVCPLKISLSLMDEMILLDHLDEFVRFGFNFEIGYEEEAGERIIKLTQIPLGKEWIGKPEDLEELIISLRDSPTRSLLSQNGEQNFVLSGLRREIAYRACRSSVMIGDSLTIDKMRKLLDQASTVRDPWHCAHNRPTIRHLCSLDNI